MLIWAKFSQTSCIIRVKILDSTSTTGAGKTGLTFSSTGLIISTIADSEATATAYTVAGSTIETITTLGTYAAPTATKCRFKEVDATNHKGIYEIQLADARFAIASSKSLLISISGATGAAECDAVIPLPTVDLFDSVRAGMTALPNAAAAASGGLFTRGTGAGQINQDANGRIDCNNVAWLGGTIAAVNVTGVPKVDVVDWLGTAPSTPTVAGVPNVNVKTWNDLTTVALPLVPTTAGRTLDVSTTGEAGVDWANVGSPTTTVGLTGTTISTSQVVASVTGAVGSVTGLTASDVGAIKTKTDFLPSATAGAAGGVFIAGTNAATTVTTALTTTFTGNLTGSVGSVTGAVGSVTGAVGSVTARVTANVDQVDGATLDTHDAGSFPADVRTWVGSAPNALVSGRVDASVGAVAASQDVAVRRGTAQTGAAGSITLDSGASATDSLYQWGRIGILSGTGAGQSRLITGYTGSTKVATVAPNWTTNPDSTSVFAIVPNGRAIVGYVLESVVTAAAAGVLDVNAKNLGGTAQTGRDIGASVLLSSGTGTGQLDFTSGVVKANTTQVDGVALTAHASGKVPVDVLTIAGTTQTARDIGASVLLSSGTGTGQLDFTSGVVKGNVTQIVGGTVPTPNVTGVPKVDPVVTSIIATVNDASATTTSFIGANSLSASNDFYTGSVLAFRSGTLQGIARRITSYVGATRTLVFTVGFPTAPANTDSFEILGKID